MNNGHPRAFVLTLRGAGERFKRCQDHFTESGVKAEPFYGLDYRITGLQTEHKYELDNPGYRMGQKQVSLHLSHYMLWSMLSHQPEDEFDGTKTGAIGLIPHGLYFQRIGTSCGSGAVVRTTSRNGKLIKTFTS